MGSADCPRSVVTSRPSSRSRFKAYPIGYFHIDIAEVHTEQGKLHLFVAVDRTSKFAFAQLHEAANVRTSAAFLEALIAAIPYKIHTVLTDNGVQFCDLPQHRAGPTARYGLHNFERVCRQHDVEHRLTKPNHPWTNGQVERMNTSRRPLCADITTLHISSSGNTSSPSWTPITL